MENNRSHGSSLPLQIRRSTQDRLGPKPATGPEYEKRFWSRIDFSGAAAGNPCWEWAGGKFNHGYGRFHIDGKDVLAHRYAYEITHQEPADGLDVRHTCDNPGCCRPEHLVAGTTKENMEDMVAKRRNACKLSVDIARRIREEFVPYSKTNGGPALGRKYGVSCSNITAIARGQIWNHD